MRPPPPPPLLLYPSVSLQVLCKNTLGTCAPNPNHLLLTQKPNVCLHSGTVFVLRVKIWASSLRPISCVSTQGGVCPCVCVFMLSRHVRDYRICVFLHAHLCHTAPGRALSRPQESLWERVQEGLREWVCKTVRWICVHHGCVWPWGHDRRSEQRVSTKEQHIQCRQSPTNPLLK